MILETLEAKIPLDLDMKKIDRTLRRGWPIGKFLLRISGHSELIPLVEIGYQAVVEIYKKRHPNG